MAAADPRWTDEEKKRRRSLQRERLSTAGTPDNPLIPAARDVLRDQGIRGYGQAITEGLSRDARRIGQVASDTFNTVAYGADGPEADAEVRATPQQNARDLGAMNPSAVHADTIRRDPSRFGLTRIVKTKDANGNSVYTNMGAAPEGAETRYYNQYGNREGMDATGSQVIDDPAASDDALLRAAGRARPSIEYAKRGSLERVQNEQQRALDEMDPESRARIMVAQLGEAGANQRASLDRQTQLEVAGARGAGASAEAALEADRYERELIRENPAAAISETLDSLGNVSPNDRIRVLADPNDPRAARVRSAVRRLAVQQGADPNAPLAAYSRTGGLRRALTGSRFTDNAGFGILGNGFDPQEFGLTDEEFEALINTERQVRSRPNR